MHTAYVYDMSVCESYRAGDRESSKISPLKNRYIQVDIRITVMNIHKEFRLNFPLSKIFKRPCILYTPQEFRWYNE